MPRIPSVSELARETHVEKEEVGKCVQIAYCSIDHKLSPFFEVKLELTNPSLK